MKNKENKNTIKEETRKLTKLDDDQIDGVAGGLDDISIVISSEANPFGAVDRINVYNIDDKARENG